MIPFGVISLKPDLVLLPAELIAGYGYRAGVVSEARPKTYSLFVGWWQERSHIIEESNTQIHIVPHFNSFILSILSTLHKPLILKGYSLKDNNMQIVIDGVSNPCYHGKTN